MNQKTQTQHLSRRKFLGLSLTVAGSSVLAACAQASVPAAVPAATTAPAEPASNTPTAVAQPAASEAITLRWVSVVQKETPYGEARFRVIDKYKQKNPNVTVEYEVLPYDQFGIQLVTRALAGDAPEIAQAGYQTAQFAVSDVLVETGPYIQRDGLKKEDYWPALWEILDFGGKTYGMPFTIDTRFTYVNEGLYQKMGITEPKTWDDMLASAKPARDQGIHAWGMITVPEVLGLWQTGASIFKTNGGSVLKVNADNTATATMSSPEIVETVEFIQRLIKEEVLPPSVLTDGDPEVTSQFRKNQTATYPIGNWMIINHDKAKEKGEMDFTPKLIHHPINKQQGSAAGGWAWYIFKTIKNPDVGWDFVSFFLKDENVQEGWADSLPPSKPNMSLPLYGGEPRNKFVSEVLDYSSWPVPPVSGWFELMPVVWRNVMRALSGQASAADAMNTADAEIQALLDKGHNTVVKGTK